MKKISDRLNLDNLNFDIEEKLNLTDLGNAERLIKQRGQDLHYCFMSKKWLIWNGKRWVQDDDGEIYRRAKETIRKIPEETDGIFDEDERKKLQEHSKRSESRARLSAMIQLAQNEPGIPVSPIAFDTNPFLLNVNNGTINLRSEGFREHRREDLLTKMAPVDYDPTACCPSWITFLETIMAGNHELNKYLQKAIGYSLSGDTSEQCLFFLLGSGANGKSTFLETIRRLFGEYARQMDFSSIIKSSQDRVRNDIARLQGARFVSACEVENGKHLSESLVKQLTGTDMVTARFLRKEYFEFKPSFKLFLAANHKPLIRGLDNGIWRRIRLIPFQVSTPSEEQDRYLPDKLRNELPGILNWALEGFRLWKIEGLEPPHQVLESCNSYRDDMDPLKDFLDSCCIQIPDARVSDKDLYHKYLDWTSQNDESPISKRALSSYLREKGFKHLRSNGGLFYWQGIGLSSE